MIERGARVLSSDLNNYKQHHLYSN